MGIYRLGLGSLPPLSIVHHTLLHMRERRKGKAFVCSCMRRELRRSPFAPLFLSPVPIRLDLGALVPHYCH
eukprot:scaffold162462_cov46-Tisochrysis_lutea.AAC.1